MPHPFVVKLLILFRAWLLSLAPHNSLAASLERKLRKTFYDWFHAGSLSLVQIEWEKTPPSVLQKLIKYEAVHPIPSMEALKNRLGKGRRIFAFFHSQMPLQPLIFLQVAFTKGMGSNVQAILDQNRIPLSITEADTATFYSISNAQPGLRGINFGHSLIKRAVCTISREYPHINTFTTLSPIPDFRAWLEPRLAVGTPHLSSTEQELLRLTLQDKWQSQTEISEQIRPILLRLCAHYLAREKEQGRPLDPVANFHLRNGAMLEQLHWLADVSEKGMRQSYGIMVNYHYKLEKIEENQQEFAAGGKVVASRSIEGYL